MTPKIKFQVVPLSEVARNDIDIVVTARPLVLIVDDEKLIADTLSIILSRHGFSTLKAYDGHSALEFAIKARPSLLISDVVMPMMSGVELAMSVVKIIPECKVLLFSGQAATVDLLHKAREAGHNFTTLAKPVHPTDMLRRVKGYFSEDEIADLSRETLAGSSYSLQ